MANANNLFSSTEGYLLRQTLKKFGKIYGVKDGNSFMQILLRGTQGAVDQNQAPSAALESNTSEVSSELEEVADAIISLQGDGIQTQRMIKVFEDFISGNATDELADHFADPPNENHHPIISITSPSPHGLGAKGYLRNRAVTEVLGISDFDFRID